MFFSLTDDTSRYLTALRNKKHVPVKITCKHRQSNRKQTVHEFPRWGLHPSLQYSHSWVDVLITIAAGEVWEGQWPWLSTHKCLLIINKIKNKIKEI